MYDYSYVAVDPSLPHAEVAIVSGLALVTSLLASVTLAGTGHPVVAVAVGMLAAPALLMLAAAVALGAWHCARQPQVRRSEMLTTWS